jgi:hypothetical protein
VIRHLVCTPILIVVFALPGSAQLLPAAAPGALLVGTEQTPVPTPDVQPPPPPGAPKAGQKPVPTPPAAPQLPVPGPARRRGREVNVQVELTITDQVGGGKPETRVVSMVVADGAFGRIRSVSESNVEKLNVDASPELLEGDRMWISLAVEYVPLRAESAVRRPAMLNEQMSVILQSGRPMLISQAADPLTDRKTTVEVRATIIK